MDAMDATPTGGLDVPASQSPKSEFLSCFAKVINFNVHCHFWTQHV
jgi:hypothetical protein